MELKIINPTEDGFIKEISFNHEEIKKELASRLEKYKGLVYSEEEIKLAKMDRATLNKFKEAIENKRKEIKTACLRPYEAFERKVKEILALVDQPVLEIDKQVKGFEEKKKQEKKEAIEEYFSQNIGDLKDILQLDKFWNAKWLNTTYKLPTIQAEIQKQIDDFAKNLKTIESIESKFQLQMKSKFLDTLLLSEAIAVKTKLEEQEQKLEEYKKKEAAAAAQKSVERAVKPTTPPPVTVKVEDGKFVAEEQLEELYFRVRVTAAQKKLLREFILSNEIICLKA